LAKVQRTSGDKNVQVCQLIKKGSSYLDELQFEEQENCRHRDIGNLIENCSKQRQSSLAMLYILWRKGAARKVYLVEITNICVVI